MAYSKKSYPLTGDAVTQGTVGDRQTAGDLDSDHQIPQREKAEGASTGADVSYSSVVDALDYYKADVGSTVLSDADQSVDKPRRYLMTPTTTRTLTLGTGYDQGDVVHVVNLASAQNIVVDANDSSAILTLNGGAEISLMALQDSPGQASHWRIGPSYLKDATLDSPTITGSTGSFALGTGSADRNLQFATDANILWDESADRFVFDKNVKTSLRFIADSGGTESCQVSGDLGQVSATSSGGVPFTSINEGDDNSTASDYFYAYRSGVVATGKLATDASGVFSLSDLSDARLKTDIADYTEDAVQIIKDIRVRRYRYVDGANIATGFVGQEMEQAYPQAVSIDEDGMYSVSRERLVEPLVRAVQMLIDRVEALEKRKIND